MRRRSVLMGLGTIVAAPRPVVAQREEPSAAVARLTRELSEALRLATGDQFRAIVEPDGNVWLQGTHLPAPGGTLT